MHRGPNRPSAGAAVSPALRAHPAIRGRRWFARSRATWSSPVGHSGATHGPCPRAPSDTPSTPRGVPRPPHRLRQRRGRTGACPPPQIPRGLGSSCRRTRYSTSTGPYCTRLPAKPANTPPPLRPKAAAGLCTTWPTRQCVRRRGLCEGHGQLGLNTPDPVLAVVHVHRRLHPHADHFDLPMLPYRSMDGAGP
jgi:hypothetical protein